MMLRKIFYNVTIICNEPKDEQHTKDGQLKHAIIHGMNDVVVDNVEWTGSDDMEPLSEDSEN